MFGKYGRVGGGMLTVVVGLLMVTVSVSVSEAQAPRRTPKTKKLSPKNRSAADNRKIEQHLDSIRGVDSTPIGNAARVQGLRDSVIGAAAVVRYVMGKEGMSKDEWGYVNEYVNVGPSKITVRLGEASEKKMMEFVDRVEVQAWIEAANRYHKEK